MLIFASNTFHSMNLIDKIIQNTLFTITTSIVLTCFLFILQMISAKIFNVLFITEFVIFFITTIIAFYLIFKNERKNNRKNNM